MKTVVFGVTCLMFSFGLYAQVNNTINDGNWREQVVVLNQTPEAEYMVRAGDIDNLGFGWTEGFNPFTGRSTEPHEYPWNPKPEDVAGTDRIMIGSNFGKKEAPCGGDGYSANAEKPTAIVLPLTILKNVTIKDAVLILFIDDFQAPTFCSKFQIKLNGKRFIEMEKQLNAIDQTGPVGKIIMMKLTPEMIELLHDNQLSIFIDDPVTGAADGFAIDFAKLIINTREVLFKGNIVGQVIVEETEKPIENATVKIPGFGEAITLDDGLFVLKNIPAGLAIITGEAKGYSSSFATSDVIAGEDSEEIKIKLKPSRTVEFTGKAIREGESVVMNKIQFAQGSAVLDSPAKTELNLISEFLTANPNVEIELSGHTSAEGSDEANRLLSLRRVQSCKAYLLGKGVDEGRITNVGYGPDKPIAPNNTEEGRILNRRVEMRITKL